MGHLVHHCRAIIMADIKVSLEQQEKVLNDNHDLIVNYLDPDDIIDELIQARMIGENAAQRLQLRGISEAARNRVIIHQIATSGPGALLKFCDILKKKKRQTFIAEQLEKCKCYTIDVSLTVINNHCLQVSVLCPIANQMFL